MRISTKAEFLHLSALGLLGNSMPSWPDSSLARAAGHCGLVMVRYKVPGSPFMRPDVPMDEADQVIDKLVDQGASRNLLYLTARSPDVGRRISAELWRGPTGLYLNYSTAQTHVRAALDADGRHAEGIAALEILRWACCPNSFDDVMALLEQYPDAVIELTAFDWWIGVLPARNTIIWEVRSNY